MTNLQNTTEFPATYFNGVTDVIEQPEIKISFWRSFIDFLCNGAELKEDEPFVILPSNF